MSAPPTGLAAAAARLEEVAAAIRTAAPEELEALADEALALAGTIADALPAALQGEPRIGEA